MGTMRENSQIYSEHSPAPRLQIPATMHSFVPVLPILLELLVFASHARIASGAPMLPTKPASAMFVFGDSILDAGSAKFLPPNSSVAALSPPYGETYFKVSTGRFSDGRTLADFLAQWINLPFTRSYMDPDAVLEIGANFASAGSRLIGEYAGAVSFKTQIDQFTERVGLLRERYGDDRAKTILRDSVFIVAIGSNDLEALYFPTNSSFRRIGSSWRYYVGMMMEEYEAAVKTLYNQGARKIVLVGVGPIGCAPAARYYVAKVGLITRRQKIGCLQTLNEMAAFFNKSLRNLVNKMLFQLPELAMVFLKPYGLLMDADSRTRGRLAAAMDCSMLAVATIHRSFARFHRRISSGTRCISPRQLISSYFATSGLVISAPRSPTTSRGSSLEK
ncbi:GDSL esterase/lipase 6 [Selaginella moellendorffii]|uniref:GDSL esterase/lipase 6 n=1 Tax=Selaginella moellendorffii TaxID=88036 RepID=UPI000D1CD38C|nr:GDSL esterase/lipase 6 [Selaginella moellendorffii]|eukprot:XP_024539167.1 GDSL esterase/lipase 6 [Selaginella moellendorffii]